MRTDPGAPGPIRDAVTGRLQAVHARLSRATELESWNLRQEWPWPALIAFGLFAFYAVCSPRTIALEDDGLFVLASYFNGIAHPPGYPLFTVIGHLFSQIPFGSVAWRVHLASALFGGLTCAVLWCIVRCLVDSRSIATAAALVYGFSEAFWSQAIIAEAYTLNTFVTLMLLWRLLELTRASKEVDTSEEGRLRASEALSVGLIYGLGLSSHWPLLLLFSPAYLILAWPLLGAFWRRFHFVATGMVVGLAPYAWLYLRSNQNLEVDFFGPIESLGALFDYVSREHYRVVDHQEWASTEDRLGYLRFLVSAFSTQFTAVGLVLVAVGLFTRRYARLILSLLIGGAGCSFLLIFLLDREYTVLNELTFRVYPLPAYAALAILLALGLRNLSCWFGNARGFGTREFIGPALLVAVVMLPFLAHVSMNYRAHYRWAETYAKAVLDEIPEDGTLLVSGDLDAFTIAYVSAVESYRDDVTLADESGHVIRQGAETTSGSGSLKGAWLAQVNGVASGASHLCYVGRDRTFDDERGVRWNGFTSCFDPSVEKERLNIRLDGASLKAYRWLRDSMENDPWTVMAQESLDATLAPVLLHLWVDYGNDSRIGREIRSDIEKSSGSLAGKVALMWYARKNGIELYPEGGSLESLRDALLDLSAAHTRDHVVRVYLLLAEEYLERGEGGRSEVYMWKAVGAKPHMTNPALAPFMTTLFKASREREISELSESAEAYTWIAEAYEAHKRRSRDVRLELFVGAYRVQVEPDGTVAIEHSSPN